MNMSVFRVALIVEVVLSTVQTEALEEHLFVRRGERKVRDIYLLKHHVSRSKAECTTMCTLSPSCTGLSWTSLGDKCSLTTGDTASQGEDNFHFEAAPNWEAMIKVIYPVAHYGGPGGTYTLKFNEAQSLCEQENTTVASAEDLFLARSLGYEFCAYGWTSDGINRLVMQFFSTACGGPLRICGGTKSNVFCRLP